jgi:hypothetical protein
LIGDDSWQTECYTSLAAKNVDIVVAVMALPVREGSRKPWLGYTTAAPADVLTSDIGSLTQQQAWMKYGLAGRLVASRARIGVATFLRGRVWDMDTDGQIVAVVDGAVHEGPLVESSSVVSVYLPPAPAQPSPVDEVATPPPAAPTEKAKPQKKPGKAKAPKKAKKR